MKKITFLFVFMCAITAHAAENPMFGDGHINSVSLSVANGTGKGSLLHLVYPGDWDFGPMTFLIATYSQPTDVLRLPARVNVSVMQNIAHDSARGLSFFGVGASWDVALIKYSGFYLGAGIGPYYRDNHDRWVSSRLFFGEKLFVGKKISPHWRAELFTIHFSNGDLTKTNHGFNFLGLSVNYSF